MYAYGPVPVTYHTILQPTLGDLVANTLPSSYRFAMHSVRQILPAWIHDTLYVVIGLFPTCVSVSLRNTSMHPVADANLQSDFDISYRELFAFTIKLGDP